MTRLFGTDGIRGHAGGFPFNAATLPLIGRAIGEHLGGRVLIGRDPRKSGPEIFAHLKLGLETGGASTKDGGILPTPAIALLIRESRLSGGIMISASHNPYKDNGIKVFGADGRKLDDVEEEGIETRVAQLRQTTGGSVSNAPALYAGGGDPAWLERYLVLLGKRFSNRKWLKGINLTLDCANGAMSGVAPGFLESLGAGVQLIHSSPNGTNINLGCGAVHPGDLIDAVRHNGSSLGVAYDGDGDRSIFVDANGRLIDGDAVLLVMSRILKKAGTLIPPLVVGTSMTNYNLERKLSEEGVKLVRTDVGDRYILREMLDSGAQLGGEPSGHIIFSDDRLSGDGLLTTLRICEAMVSEGASLDELTRDWHPSPQLLENVRVSERVPLDTLPSVVQKIDEIRRTLEGCGRIVVRYSGTEPLLRIMVESDSDSLNRACASALIEVIQKALGTNR